MLSTRLVPNIILIKAGAMQEAYYLLTLMYLAQSVELSVNDNEQEHDQRVNVVPERSEVASPTDENCHNGHVHWIACVAVEIFDD